MSDHDDNEQWVELEGGLLVPMRAGDGSPEAKAAFKAATLPGAIATLQPFYATGGPVGPYAGYELLRRKVEGLAQAIGSLLLGEPYPRSWGGNMAMLNATYARSTLGQRLVDPDSARPGGIQPALHLLQTIEAPNASVDLLRPAFLWERILKGDVRSTRALVELRERLGDGATSTGPWLTCSNGVFRINKDGGFYTRSGLFCFGSAAHVILRGGSVFVEGGAGLVAVSGGVTTDDALVSGAKFHSPSAGSAVIEDNADDTDLALTVRGDVVVSTGGRRLYDGAPSKLTAGVLKIPELSAAEVTALGTPPAGFVYVYAKESDEHVYQIDDDATETDLTTGGGGGGPADPHDLLGSTTHPDTVSASPVLGDLIVGNSTPAWTRFAGNSTTTRKFLSSTGTGAAAASPSWQALAASDIPDLSATYAEAGWHDGWSGTGNASRSITIQPAAVGEWLDLWLVGDSPGGTPTLAWTINGRDIIPSSAVSCPAPAGWVFHARLKVTGATTADVGFLGLGDVGGQGDFDSITGLDFTIAQTMTAAITGGVGGATPTIDMLEAFPVGGSGSGASATTEGISPLYLPTPALHFSATEEGHTLVSGDFSVLGDSSGNSRDLSQATSSKRPTYLADAGDGLPGIDFDGVDELLVNTTAGGTLTGSRGEIWIVVTPSTVAATQVLFSSGDTASTTRSFLVWIEVTGGNAYFGTYQENNDTADQMRGSTLLVAGQTYILRVRSDGTAYRMQVDGADETLTAVTGSNNGDWFADTADRDNFAMGALVRTSEAIFADAVIRELPVWDGVVLNTEQAAAVTARLATKWGVSL